MSWLSCKPRYTLPLTWPEGDPIVDGANTKLQTIMHKSYTNILDDQILCAFAAREETEPYTAVYLAKIPNLGSRDVTNEPEAAVVFEKIATLPFAATAMALLADQAGYVSLHCNPDQKNLTLRTHSWGGATLKEVTAPAAAVYGNLVVSRHAVGICVSSGIPPPEESQLAGSPPSGWRIDLFGVRAPLGPTELTGDQIIVWNLKGDSPSVVQIPQDWDAPLLASYSAPSHKAEFQFVGKSHIALGGRVEATFGTPSALVKVFNWKQPEELVRTFTHGVNFEFDDDSGVVGISGSSVDNSFLASYHQQGARMSVLSIDLLTGEIPSEPDTEDPEGLTSVSEHSEVCRTFKGAVSSSFPSVSHNRILVEQTDEVEEYQERFYLKGRRDGDESVFWIYDFDQARCKHLLEARESLEDRIRETNEHAMVVVVSRNFRAGIEEEDDMEWAYPDQPPPEWRQHMQDLYNRNQQRNAGDAEVPLLEFDEPPAGRSMTEHPRMLFSKSALYLPHDEDDEPRRAENLALTTSAIVNIGGFGSPGTIFYFGDPEGRDSY